MTADELIEQLCASSSNPSGITVVSRDNLLRLTATTFGATALAPDKLFDGARGCSRAMAESLRISNAAADRKWNSETRLRCSTLSIWKSARPRAGRK